jgi:hypothetical protein
MFTIDNFISGLQNTLPYFQFTQNGDKLIILRINGESSLVTEQNQFIGEIPLMEIQAIIDEIPDGTTFFDYMLCKKVSFEVPIKSQDRMRMPYRFSDRDLYSVSEHNYKFLISKASSQYIFALLCFSSTHPEVNFDFLFMHINMREYVIKSLQDLCDLFRVLTAKIIAPSEYSLSEFKKMLQSYLFNISYNNNIVFAVADLSEERQPQRHSVRRGGQLFPYKSYNSELVKYYYQGASTDIPFTQYLAFYHVAEFFFQTIVEQDAFQEIENFITRPSFSPYKKEDIRHLPVLIAVYKTVIRNQTASQRS